MYRRKTNRDLMKVKGIFFSQNPKSKRPQKLPVMNLKFLPLATRSFHDLYLCKLSKVPGNKAF